MSITTKVLAAAATLTVAGGLCTAGTLPASAATTQCGTTGTQIFSKEFGTYTNPRFIESVFLGIPLAGVPTILHRASKLTRRGTSSSPSAIRYTCLISTRKGWCPPR